MQMIIQTQISKLRAISPHISKFNDLTITLINEIGEVTLKKGESRCYSINFKRTSKKKIQKLT